METLRLSFVTYNVGTSNPEQSLLELLSLSSNPKNDRALSDMYLISFQEVKSQPQNMVIDAIYNDPWTRAVQEILETRNYIKAKTIRLQGLVLSLFCLRKHLLNIRDVETAYVRTGLSGMWGNKGGVGIRISIAGCSLCFINAHLSAHDNMLKDRIEDYYDIVKRIKFHDPITEEIFSHDYIFWMGDLNFRLGEEYEASFEHIEALIRNGKFENLLQHDQLRKIMDDNVAMHELAEVRPLTFPPTFKYKVGTSEYDDKRKPAWTDRILFKVNEKNYENVTLKVDLLKDSYKCHPFYTLSDHKPVTCDFNIKVFDDYGDQFIRFEPIVAWLEDQDNVIRYDVTKEFPLSKNDWIGVFKESYSSLDDYLTYEYVTKAYSPLPVAKVPHPGASSGTPGLMRQAQSYQCTFSTVPDVDSLANANICLLYVHQTEDGVISVYGVSNGFPLVGKE